MIDAKTNIARDESQDPVCRRILGMKERRYLDHGAPAFDTRWRVPTLMGFLEVEGTRFGGLSRSVVYEPFGRPLRERRPWRIEPRSRDRGQNKRI